LRCPRYIIAKCVADLLNPMAELLHVVLVVALKTKELVGVSLGIK